MTSRPVSLWKNMSRKTKRPRSRGKKSILGKEKGRFPMEDLIFIQREPKIPEISQNHGPETIYRTIKIKIIIIKKVV